MCLCFKDAIISISLLILVRSCSLDIFFFAIDLIATYKQRAVSKCECAILTFWENNFEFDKMLKKNEKALIMSDGGNKI